MLSNKNTHKAIKNAPQPLKRRLQRETNKPGMRYKNINISFPINLHKISHNINM